MFEFQKDCGLKVIKDLVEGTQNLSRIYGFILYTEKDPYVAMVLRNEDFWNALNCISGVSWPIFAVRPLQQGRNIGSMAIHDGVGREDKYWREPQANLPIIQDFGLETSRDLPLFIAFIWDDDDNLNEVTLPIRGNNIDEVYHSLEEIVKAIAKVEDRILPENKSTVNVFRNVKDEIEALKLKHSILLRGRMLRRFAGFLSMFK